MPAWPSTSFVAAARRPPELAARRLARGARRLRARRLPRLRRATTAATPQLPQQKVAWPLDPPLASFGADDRRGLPLRGGDGHRLDRHAPTAGSRRERAHPLDQRRDARTAWFPTAPARRDGLLDFPSGRRPIRLSASTTDKAHGSRTAPAAADNWGVSPTVGAPLTRTITRPLDRERADRAGAVSSPVRIRADDVPFDAASYCGTSSLATAA